MRLIKRGGGQLYTQSDNLNGGGDEALVETDAVCGFVVTMKQETITYSCRVCGSTNIVKNGSNRLGQKQYHCKECNAYRVLESKREAKKKRSASS